MCLPYVCGRCARRIDKIQGVVSRSYSSLGQTTNTDESVVLPQARRPIVRSVRTRISQNEGTSRARANHDYYDTRRSSDDKVLESLFSSNLNSSKQPTRSRYSRTPISQHGLANNGSLNDELSPSGQVLKFSPTVQDGILRPSDVNTYEPTKAPQGVLESPEGHEHKSSAPVPEQSPSYRLRRFRYASPSTGMTKGNAETRDMIPTLTKDIDNALMTSNTQKAIFVWDKTQSYLKDHKIQDLAKLDILFTKLLSAFFQLRRAEAAIEVWNYMVQGGYEVNKVHWNAMLHGCSKSRDASSLQEIWKNMSSSADTALWTTYIIGLIRCRLWERGFDAINQLGRLWTAKGESKKNRRYRGEIPEDLKPSLAPINAAIDALISIEKGDLVPGILQWASTHGIQPDTHTFNSILRPIARTGDLKAINAHLTHMSTNNCQPDIATFTIILSSLISSPHSNFRTLSPTEQESTIITILDDMLAANVPPNAYTYSTLLSTLLKQSSKNHSSYPKKTQSTTSEIPTPNNVALAETLVAHMQAKSVNPTPHIYTILFAHHFSQPEPDLAAIHGLWQDMKSSSTLPDPIFYDRMIEGLAKADQAGESLKFVKLMKKDGKMLSWVAIGLCLEALVKERNGEAVQWLVREVERPGGLMKFGGRDLRGKKSWERRVSDLKTEGGWFETVSDEVERI